MRNDDESHRLGLYPSRVGSGQIGLNRVRDRVGSDKVMHGFCESGNICCKYHLTLLFRFLYCARRVGLDGVGSKMYVIDTHGRVGSDFMCGLCWVAGRGKMDPRATDIYCTPASTIRATA